MKASLLLLVLAVVAGCATSRIQTADPVVDKLLDKVVVERIDLDLASPQDHEGELLWDTFVNKQYESQFSSLTTRNWHINSKRFQARLLSQAKAGGFDVESLRKVLAGLDIKPSDRTARIPVGAFAARKGSDDVWIIVLKWEFAYFNKKYDENHWLWRERALGHIEVIAFRMKDGKKVDYFRCA
jgi:hypothetical protein